MEKNPSVYIIIPVHNGLESTIKCIHNISKLIYTNTKTIIVDDGSSDGSYDYINSHYPDMILLSGTGNLWWSGSVNLGVRYALDNHADYICLLNNDNTFNHDFLSILMETAQWNEAQAVCSKVYFKDSEIVFFAGGSRNKWGELRMVDGKDREEFNLGKDIEWIIGMGVLIKSQVFRDIGFFDEKNFPQYYGDSDFGLRMYERGYKIYFQPESVIYNDFESTGISIYSGKLSHLFKTFFSIKSVNNIRICFRFYRKHAPKFAFLLTLKMILRTIYNYFRVIFSRKSKLELKKEK